MDNSEKEPFFYRAKQFVERHYLWVFLAAMVIVAFYYGAVRLISVDFMPTNGDFQSYNAFRRTLAGQIPYKDFANYLGIGALLVNLPLLIFHNTFAGSLFVTHFTVCILFMTSIFVVMYLCTHKKLFSVTVALLFPKLVSGKFLTLIPGLGYLVDLDFGLLALPNNSLRMVRTFLPFLIILVFFAFMKRYAKKRGEPFVLLCHLLDLRFVGAAAFFIGFCMVWSNDFGFACIGSAFLIYLILLFTQYWGRMKLTVKPLLCYLGFTVLGCFASVAVFTLGNIKSFLRFTAGVAGYQYWYFGTAAGDKINSVLEYLQNTRLVFFTLLFLAIMVFCLVLLLRKKATNATIALVFIELSVYLGALIYIYGSGGYHFQEALESYTMLILAGGAAWLFFWLVGGRAAPFLKKLALALCAVVAVGYTGYMAASGALQLRDLKYGPKEWYYVDALEGYTRYAEPLNEQAAIVGDEPFFSTYATALDLMKGQFQPTGCDYIIHALGDEQREEYIKAFEQGNYRFVQGINMDTWIWEYWIVRSNWDFYQLLYRDYDRVYRDSNWYIWEKRDTPNVLSNVNITVKTEKLSDQTTAITVTSDTTVECTASLHLNYTSAYENNLYRLQTWKRSVFMNDSYVEGRAGTITGIFLPLEQTDRVVPVCLRPGESVTLTLSSQPADCTSLEVLGVTVGEVYGLI